MRLVTFVISAAGAISPDAQGLLAAVSHCWRLTSLFSLPPLFLVRLSAHPVEYVPKTHTVKNWGPESTSSLRDSSLSLVHQLRLPVPVPNQSQPLPRDCSPSASPRLFLGLRPRLLAQSRPQSHWPPTCCTCESAIFGAECL